MSQVKKEAVITAIQDAIQVSIIDEAVEMDPDGVQELKNVINTAINSELGKPGDLDRTEFPLVFENVLGYFSVKRTTIDFTRAQRVNSVTINYINVT